MEEWKQHTCNKLPENGVMVLWSKNFHDRDSQTWSLIVERETTEEDLEENSLYEQVGETIWTTAVEISFCPYCGEKLFEESNLLDYGQFALHDHSKCSMEVK